MDFKVIEEAKKKIIEEEITTLSSRVLLKLDVRIKEFEEKIKILKEDLHSLKIAVETDDHDKVYEIAGKFEVISVRRQF